MGKLVEDASRRRTVMTTGEKIRLVMMCLVLVFLLFYFYNHTTYLNTTAKPDPWYLGDEREYQNLIKPDIPKKQRLKEQKGLKRPPLIVDKNKFPPQWDFAEFQKEVKQNIKYFRDKPWLKILHKICTMSQAEIEEEIKKQDKEEKITYKHIIKVPEKLPGLFVDFKGSIARIRRKEILSKNEFGLTEIWEGQLFDKEYRIISFHIIDPPTELYKWDPVSIRGMFYKNWVYEDTLGELKGTPLIVGRMLVKIPKTVDTSSQSFQLVVVVCIIIGGIALAVIIWVEAKRSEKHRIEFQQKQRENAKKRKAKKENSKVPTKTPPSETQEPQPEEKTESAGSSEEHPSEE